MYTPITKRVKVAQHKSSVAKSTEDEKKRTQTAQTANEQGNLQNTTGTGNEGGTETKKRLSYREAYDQDIEGVRTGGKYANFDDYVSDREKQRKTNPQAFEADMFAKTGVSGGPGQTTTNTPGNAKFESKPVMQDAKAASKIDLMGPQELRGNTRAGKIAARNVKKASKQYERMQKKFNDGKISQKVLDAYKNELDNTVSRSENIGQQASGMRNRYLTQTMDYDRGENLKAAQDAGPVKAPKGTQTEEEFKSNFKKELGINGGSSNPQTATTPTSSFSEMAATSYKPITLNTGALFEGLDSSISAFANKIKKGGVGKMTNKPGAFKLKGYGSRR